MPKRILCYAIASLLSFSVYGQYTYESGQDLYHLQTNANDFEGELAYSVSDDGISPAIDLSFNFTFYGTTFSQARMATNGCLHFGNSGSYCNDYTPDPINGQHTYTIYGFWTDLIRDNNSRMKSWGDNSKMIFGWYDLREYNRSNTDNSFEIILWNNNSFDIRYGGLNIINHDVLIGEIGANKENSYTYYYHDECSTGTTNSSTCVNTNWNNTTINTTLENGGSLFGWGTGSGVDCSDPLNDSSCSGYAQAYLTQQCNITQLHSESCPNYWEAYDDEQCRQDSQYAPFCAGYTQEESVAFFDDSNVDYGFVDEQEQFATGIFEDDYHDDYGFEEQFTVVEIFEDEMFPSFEEFGDDNFEEYFDGSEPEELIIFFEPEPLPFINDFVPYHDEPLHHQDDILLDEFIFQETFLVEDYSEPETFIEFNSIDELEEWFEEETNEPFEERLEERLADLDEPEEEFIEEIFEEEAVEEIFEEIEEMQEMMEEELIAEREEEAREEILEEVVEEFEAIETESPTGKNKLMVTALNVVRAGIQTASNSYSQASGGSQTNNATNNSSSTNLTTGGSTASSGGISTSSSPSASDQFASATQQSNQVLSMSNDMGGSNSMSMSITPLPTFDNSASMVIADVQVQNVQGEIDTASSGVMTASEADQIADKIIAQNIEAQQEEIEEQQQETGKYGDESKLIALIGYVPAFNNYSQVSVPDATDWYISANIYTSATLDDNTGAFYGLVNENLKGLNEMISDEPNIWR
jgi:hypothetical protein